MELDIFGILDAHRELGLFVILGLGYAVGKIGVRGVKLGSPMGVLFAGLFFGHHGFALSPLIGTLGFIFFIYSVGYEAGPRFFSSFQLDGVRYVQLGLVLAATAIGTTMLAAQVLSLAPGYAAGVLAGALTSTPTLAAAQDALTSGLVDPREGYTIETVKNNIAVAYAVTYVIGLAGLIVVLQILPRLLRLDLEGDARALAALASADKDGDDEMGLAGKGMPSLRIYEMRREQFYGKSLDDLKFLQATGAVICQLRRAETLIELGPDTRLEQGDHIVVLGYRANQIRAARIIGEEIDDPDLEKTPISTRQICLTNREVAGRTLRELGITNTYACITNRVMRGGVELPAQLDMRMEYGDYLVVSGPEPNLERVIAALGIAEPPEHQTDLLTFCLGIAAGLIVGYTTFKVGTLPLGIGTAGGLLVVGLLVGRLRGIHPLFGRVPPGARFLLMELGLMLFLAGVGVRAGAGLLAGLTSAGPSLVLSGVIVMLLPTLVGVAYGRYVLGMNSAILFGALTGGLTSTPALGAVKAQARSNVPAIGYAGVYAFANILLAIAGQLIMILE